MATRTRAPQQSQPQAPASLDDESINELPPSPSDDEIDLNDEDTDTVDDLPVATDRHPRSSS